MATLSLSDPTKPAHPKGIFKAVVASHEVTEPGLYGSRFKWQLVTPKGVLSHYTGMKYSMHPKATLYPFVKAVLGEAPQELEPEDLYGKNVNVLVDHIEKVSAGGEKAVYDRITQCFNAEDPFAGE